MKGFGRTISLRAAGRGAAAFWATAAAGVWLAAGTTSLRAGEPAAYDYPLQALASILPGGTNISPVPPCTLMALVDVREAGVTNVQLFFDSTDDLRVLPTNVVVRLDKGKRTGVNLEIYPGAGQPAADGSWIRGRVSYAPDYAALLRQASDTNRYPDADRRGELLDRIRKAQEQAGPATQAFRFFFPSARPGRVMKAR